MGAIFCTKCGHYNPESSIYCARCGKPLEKTESHEGETTVGLPAVEAETEEEAYEKAIDDIAPNTEFTEKGCEYEVGVRAVNEEGGTDE